MMIKPGMTAIPRLFLLLEYKAYIKHVYSYLYASWQHAIYLTCQIPTYQK